MRPLHRVLLALTLATLAACTEGEPYVAILADRSPLRPGDSLQLVASYQQDEVYFPFASSIRQLDSSETSPGAFRWSSSDTLVARVDDRGMLFARREGSVVIGVRTRGVRDRETIIVDP